MSGSTIKRKRRPSEVNSSGVVDESSQPDQDTGNPGTAGDVTDDSEAHPRERQKDIRNLEAEPALLPSPSVYLPLVVGGAHWQGIYDTLENIVTFGDSYTKTNNVETCVKYLERQASDSSHNFALPGATGEDGLSSQLSRFFTKFPPKVSPDAPPALDPGRTTYFIFLGINDCGKTDSDDLEPIIEAIFDATHDLYVKAGARNFVLLNVPPLDRSPQAVNAESSEPVEERVKVWNELLQRQATEFARSTPKATVLLYSTHHLLTEILDDPGDFSFSDEAATTEGEGIWLDDLHLTEDVHEILAGSLFNALRPDP